MTLKETLDDFRAVIGKHTDTINGYSGKIDGLIECQTAMRADVKEIKIVLAGDDFGNEGLVKSHKDIRQKFFELRDDVKKIKVIGTVLSAIITGIIGLIGVFK